MPTRWTRTGHRPADPKASAAAAGLSCGTPHGRSTPGRRDPAAGSPTAPETAPATTPQHPRRNPPGRSGTAAGSPTAVDPASAAPPGRRGRKVPGRWGTVVGLSAAGLCLVPGLAACGSGGGGYTAVGPAGGPTGTAARPTGSVTLVPLDGPNGTADRSTGSASGPGGSPTPVGGAATGAGPSSAAGGQDGTDGSGDPAGGPGGVGDSADGPGGVGDPADGPGGVGDPAGGPGGVGDSADGPAGSVPAPSASPSGAASTRPRPSGSASTRPRPSGPAASGTPAPAALTWSAPTREATDRRWCEKVTVTFRNSGGTAVRSGTITLGTHIIDLLGTDWATIGSTRPLPVPIAPRARTDRTWTVCVDAWRVPLGMHVETRVVGVDWS
ncbi:hypothetical protein [Streptomyces sp. NPDC021562]|uniref:hypothetical protein n=1 Tax=Streptomyces sp. NPDC021562 TaxID=3155121 RepID=UPI0033EF14AC